MGKKELIFYAYVQKELLEFCSGVEKTHRLMMVEFAGKEAEMLCNPRHMMTYQLEFRTLAALAQTEGYISGGHVGLYLEDLVKNGLIKIVREEALFGGCRALEIEHVFGSKIAQKTIWPKHWSAEQIMDAIKEAWHNQIYYDERILGQKKSLRIVGVDRSGIKIDIILNELFNNQLKLKTAYPYCEKFAGLKL